MTSSAHTLIVQPEDGRNLVLNALNAAKTFIDLTIYEISDSQIMSALEAAKKRGFPPDMQQRDILPAIQELTKAGIQCRQASKTLK